MDTLEGLYSFFGTSDPAMLALDLVVAAIFSIAIVCLLLELLRIFREYSRKVPAQAYEKPQAKVEEKPVVSAAKVEPKPEVKVEPKPVTKVEPKVEPKPAEKIPDIDVLKVALPDSMKAIAVKYKLESLTLSTQDGLVIASTSSSADQDAAVYSGLFQELFKVKQEPYYYIESKDVSLYYVESGTVKVVGVARRRTQLTADEQKAIRDDTKKVVDKFASGKK
ncbi:MAG TPA: hypothetical protein VGK13_02880 [Methanocellaceae archaeon]